MSEQLNYGPPGEIPVNINEKYIPNRTEYLKEYEINIKFLSIGCVINIGCKSVPFSTVKEGLEALTEYIKNPYETRKIWEEKFAKQETL